MKKSAAIIFLLLFWIAFNCTGQSQQHVDSMEMILYAEHDPIQKVELMLSLVEELKSSNQESTLQYAQQALTLSRTNSYSKGELRSLIALGEIYSDRTEFKIAMDYVMEAKLLAEQLEDKKLLSHALYYMGKIYTSLGNYEKSSELYYECLQLSEQMKDQETEVMALNSIGVVYHNQNNFDKALEYYYKALTIAREIDYKKGIARGLNNVAAMYGYQEKYTKFVKILREAIALNLEQGDLNMVGINYFNLGYYFQVQEEYDSALYYFNSALDIYQRLNNTSSITSAKIFLAEFYLQTGQLKESKTYALESLEEGRASKRKRLVYETYVLLSEIYFKEMDSMSAYQYQILELQMKDSLNIEDSQTEMSKLELQYEFEKAEQKKRIIQQRKNLGNVIILITLIFIIIFIILLLGRIRMKARSVMLEKDKLEINLELRNKELTANVMSIMKKNETLTQIASRLKGIQKEAVKDETKKAIRKISVELNKAVDDEPWEEFELRFKQVHSDFFTALIEQFPNLSPQEQRLCALLRLNMTSKEISGITGQQVATIEMARTRLRKKIGITNTSTNLITFLAQIGKIE